MSTQIFKYNQSFKLESGQQLSELEIGYHTYGKLNEQRSNVVWVCHALTANSDVIDWWKGLFGEGYYFDPEKYFIVCANILGSHYGTTNALSTNPATGEPYYLTFPDYTIRDIVNAHQLLAEHLNIVRIEVLMGGSLGGQQALEWGIMQPDRIENLILIASNARHSAWGIAFNQSQRLALSADATFYNNKPDGGSKGLKAARTIALLSYRTYGIYSETQYDETDELGNHRAASYQNYQGQKLVERFNAYSYWYLTKVMDSHNAGRNRVNIATALNTIIAKTLVIGIKSDILFPLQEQQYLAKQIPSAVLAEIDSIYGHDGFLVETGALTKTISSFLKTDVKEKVTNLHQTA